MSSLILDLKCSCSIWILCPNSIKSLERSTDLSYSQMSYKDMDINLTESKLCSLVGEGLLLYESLKTFDKVARQNLRIKSSIDTLSIISNLLRGLLIFNG